MSRSKLYDSPPDDFHIRGGRIQRRPIDTLAALQWAADREGVSYGRFTLNLSSADQACIRAENEAFIARQKGGVR